MAHIIVQVIQMLACTGLGAAVIAIFAVAVISIVHGLHPAGGSTEIRARSTDLNTPGGTPAHGPSAQNQRYLEPSLSTPRLTRTSAALTCSRIAFTQ